MSQSTETRSDQRQEPVAIVGIGCRFPGASGPGEFWRLLAEGRNAVGEIPQSRLDVAALYDPRPARPGRIATRSGGFLPDIEDFDAAFFQISPREAERLDPQQRLLLELSWEALEDAGQVPSQLRGTRTGVFVGVWLNDWEARLFRDPDRIDFHMTTGSGRYAAPGRISQFLGIRGPSMAIDTACSSSLVAVHLACQSLWSGECEMALAGGVNIILEPAITIAYSQARMMAPDGQCKFGDARADGYVRSEGAGIVMLKPLGRAIADGDSVYALIAGTAVNNDGGSGGSFGTPGRAGQEDLLRTAYRRAGVAPGDVQYVEVHGTGTAAGDPVELEALAAVLSEGRPGGRHCVVGSVKTNIGHTEGAAGVAGLIKVALSLREGALPGSLHFEQPSPRIAWATLPLEIRGALGPWPESSAPHRAGVSSFGIAGTNAHVVLEEAPPFARTVGGAAARPVRLLALSAKSAEALRALADRWVPVLDREEASADLADLCYTANVRRTHHAHRLAVAGATPAEMAARLRAHLAGEARAGVAVGQTRGDRPRVVFVFPGQGSQWLGMGRRLVETEPVFRAALERCALALAPHVDWSLIGELEADATRSQLDRIDVVQPVLFAIQVALAALWRSFGVEPDAVVGHSMGEVAAAHVAGALSLDDAARVIATRSRLLRRIAGQGAMAMVELSLEGAREALRGREDRLSIAVSNSARSTVLSGDVAALDDLLAELEGRAVFCRRVRVDVASHSPHVDPLRADLLAELRDVAPRATTLPLRSTVTGETVAGEDLGAAYWVRNLREPVLFTTAVGRLIAEGAEAFVEMSPHPALLAALQEALADAGPGRGIAVASGRREEDEQVVVRESLGALWARGLPLDWARLSAPGARVVPLPAYPWQRERFWYETSPASRTRGGRGGHAWLGAPVALALPPGGHLWDGEVAAGDYPCLRDGHAALPVVSAGAALGAVLDAAAEPDPVTRALDDVRFSGSLPLGGAPSKLQLVMAPANGDRLEMRLLGRTADSPWSCLVAGTVGAPDADPGHPAPGDLATLRSRLVEADPDVPTAWRRGQHPSPVRRLWLGAGEALARLAEAGAEPCPLHPVTLDAIVRVLAEAAEAPEGTSAWRLCRLGRVLVQDRPGPPAWVHVRHAVAGAGRLTGDVQVLDETGQVLQDLERVELEPPAPASPADLLYRVDWPAQPASGIGAPPSGGTFILVGSPARLQPLIAGLGARGQRVAVVAPDEIEGLARALDAGRGVGPGIAGVVHLASLEVDPSASPLASPAAAASWGSGLATVQVLARQGRGAPRLWLVTRGARRVGPGDGAPSLAAGTLWGFGAAVAHEHPDLRCVRLDLPVGGGDEDLAALAAELMTGGDEDEIALRAGVRHVARLVRHAPAPAAVAIAETGTYLLSGGLGGLGLAVARWLVGRGARHLVLVGRRAPSPEAIRVMEDLRGAGAEVVPARGDVAQWNDVQRIVGALPADRPVRAIVHAAGILDDGVIANLDPARFAAVLAPKIAGALNLHAATAGADLDFFALCSSALGVLGAAGQANYAAANAALDAFAARLRAEGRPAVSIAWGPWSDVGLAAARGDRGKRLAARGLPSLSPEEGVGALDGVLGGDLAEVMVTHLDPARYRRAHAAGARSLLADFCSGPPAGALEEGIVPKLRAAAGPQRRAALEAWLREEVGRVLRVPPARIDASEPLRAMGLDSLLSLELRNRLEGALGLSLPATVIWNYPTVVALAGNLEARLGLAGPHELTAVSAPGPAEDPAEVEGLLAEIEGLSEDEVVRLLAEDEAEGASRE